MKFFERATPEECGISSESIINFIEAMCQGEENQETHSFLLLRHGKIVCEGYFAPYTRETEHTLFSVSKSFTSTAIGLLEAEGKLSLDDSVSKYFPELITENINKENLKIKIRDLLSMSFGQQGGAVHEAQKRSDMADVMLYDFFYREKDIECGETFRYDGYGTYMLAAIVRKITGLNVVEFLMPKIFEPLDIKKPHYVTDEIGNNIGYTGMRMRAVDLAKVGMLFLNKGKYGEKQLVPEEWINLATKKHIPTETCVTGTDWQQGYCYQFWKGRYNTTRLCGAYGQMCVIMPDYDAIFVVNSGYDNNKLSYILESFYENIMFNMKDSPLPEDKENTKKLADILANLKLPFKFSSMSPLAKIINGNTYEIPEKGIYKAVKFDFSEDEVKVTLVSNVKNFEFVAGFNKVVSGRAEDTHFAALDKLDMLDTAATAVWTTSKNLEITLRLVGSPSIAKIIADFSKEPAVEFVTIRCKF